MPAPSPLAIATSAVNRLVKEEASYHREYQHQKAKIAQLEQRPITGSDAVEDENADYLLKQERKALEETQAIFPALKQKIQDASSKLETQLETDQRSDKASVEDIRAAREAMAAALKAVGEASS